MIQILSNGSGSSNGIGHRRWAGAGSTGFPPASVEVPPNVRADKMPAYRVFSVSP